MRLLQEVSLTLEGWETFIIHKFWVAWARVRQTYRLSARYYPCHARYYPYHAGYYPCHARNHPHHARYHPYHARYLL